ncbi:MAG TPA: inorganic phosphate transporter [Solirubrobacteraceae bacterium]|nr:inorganic phosphate transporter [Solirubrobacteraceae bacterium]
MGNELLLVIVIGTALAFDFTNGFHDTANAMATSIATRALPPRVAVALAAVLNVAGAFLSLKVATTISKDIVDSSQISLEVLLAALVGAISWNLVTWLFSLPSSSTHALIGGVIGAAWIADGSGAVDVDGVVGTVIVPAVVSPVIAGAVAVLGTFLAFKIARRLSGGVGTRGYRVGQIGSASLVSLAHGTNDAQKTMGVITLALVVHGSLDKSAGTPTWVILAAALSIGLGTYVGGWRIIETMGHKLTKIEPPQGFAAESSAASVLLASSYFGYPLSTTHIVSGAVVGSGIGRRLSEVRWSLARRIVLAWLVTLPAAAAVAAGVYEAVTQLGGHSAGPVLMAVLALAAAGALFRIAQRHPVTASDV